MKANEGVGTSGMYSDVSTAASTSPISRESEAGRNFVSSLRDSFGPAHDHVLGQLNFIASQECVPSVTYALQEIYASPNSASNDYLSSKIDMITGGIIRSLSAMDVYLPMNHSLSSDKQSVKQLTHMSVSAVTSTQTGGELSPMFSSDGPRSPHYSDDRPLMDASPQLDVSILSSTILGAVLNSVSYLVSARTSSGLGHPSFTSAVDGAAYGAMAGGVRAMVAHALPGGELLADMASLSVIVAGQQSRCSSFVDGGVLTDNERRGIVRRSIGGGLGGLFGAKLVSAACSHSDGHLNVLSVAIVTIAGGYFGTVVGKRVADEGFLFFKS